MSSNPSPAPTPGLPDVDRRSCQLLGPTALIVQALMGVFVVLSLIYKRHREKPHRPWRIWAFDVSKQVVGQLFVHSVNVFVSIASEDFSANACVFYFLNILIDTTLGVGIIYVFLHALTYLLSERLGFKGFESGQYGTPPSFWYWLRQAAIYIVCLTAMKFLVLGLLVAFPVISSIGEWLLSWTYTGKGDKLQVIFVMGIFPIIMNVLQFWFIDSIVKASGTVALAADADDALSGDRDDQEPLFAALSDDEGDDPAVRHTRPHDIESGRRHPESHTRSLSSSSEEPKNIPSRGDKSTGLDNTDLHHAYPPGPGSSTSPPSLSSSPDSTHRSASPSPSTPPNKPHKRRRSPPRPLDLRIYRQPAVNSPVFSAPPLSSHTANSKLQPLPPQASVEWDNSWDDNGVWTHQQAVN